MSERGLARPSRPWPVPGWPVLAVLAVLAAASSPATARPVGDAVACTQKGGGSPLSAEILTEVNRARQSPGRYAETVRAVFAGMDATGVYPRGSARVGTREGRAAVDEALRFLANADPLPPLRQSACLDVAAARHARAKGSIGGGGHIGATGSTPSDRVSRLTSRPVACSENIAYGYRDVAELVSALLVDDGVPSRGHRDNLFDPRIRSFGAGRAAHLLAGTIDVLVFCLEPVDR